MAISLGLVFRQEVPLLDVAPAMLAEAARAERVNAGLAVADLTDMVVVAFERGSPMRVGRVVAPGSRLPLGGASAGWAWLGGLPADECERRFAALAARYGSMWDAVRAEAEAGVHAVATHGFCVVRHADTPVGMSAPVRSRQLPGCVVSFAIPLATEPLDVLAARHGPGLLRLAARLEDADT